ncbi:hypothetical protein FB451DRAFT_276935 [Mycena latifolia]|nr:hypothetical protein FB451DRAFT_276935 [Mycena latifolia]
MVESSLANWNGSITSAKTTSAPIPTGIQSNGSTNVNPASSKSINALPDSKAGSSAEGSAGAHPQNILHANAPYSSRVPSSSTSISPPGTVSQLALQKVETSSPEHVVRTNFPHPPSPLHFGAPLDILTTPVSPLAPGPSWLKHTPSPEDGLIPLDIHVTSPIKAGRVAQVQVR